MRLGSQAQLASFGTLIPSQYCIYMGSKLACLTESINTITLRKASRLILFSETGFSSSIARNYV
jgi:hypothetical protein